MPRLVRNVYVMFVVLVSWVIFRADSMYYAIEFLSRMFVLQPATSQPLSVLQIASVPMLMLIIIAAFLAYPVWPRAKIMWARVTELASGPIIDDLARTAYVTAVMVLSLATMAAGQQKSFLYFRF